MQTYTQEQKRAYFTSLRERWHTAKKTADSDGEAKTLHKLHGGNYSYWSFYFVLNQMRSLHLDGIPYVDMRTFQGWREVGFKVMKGEHAKVDGIVWKKFGQDYHAAPAVDGEQERASVRLYPKMYKLFHKSQVEPLQ